MYQHTSLNVVWRMGWGGMEWGGVGGCCKVWFEKKQKNNNKLSIITDSVQFLFKVSLMKNNRIITKTRLFKYIENFTSKI